MAWDQERARRSESEQTGQNEAGRSGKDRLKSALAEGSYEEQLALLETGEANKSKSSNPFVAFFSFVKSKLGLGGDSKNAKQEMKAAGGEADQILALVEGADAATLARLAKDSSFLAKMEATLDQRQFDRAYQLLHKEVPKDGAPLAAEKVQKVAPPAPGQGGADESALEAADAQALGESDGTPVDSPEAIAETYSESFLGGMWKSNRGEAIQSALDRFSKKFSMARDLCLAVIGYTGPGYKPVNMKLRGQIKSRRFLTAIQPHEDAIKAGMASLPAGSEKQLYRVWNRYNPAIEKYRVAKPQTKVVEDPGFVSTAVEQAHDGGAFDWDGAPIRFIIDAKGGGKAVHELSLYPSEGERLYAGLRIEVFEFEETPENEPDPARRQITIHAREI